MPAPSSRSLDQFLDLAAVTADSDEEEEISDDEAQMEEFFDDLDKDDGGAAQSSAVDRSSVVEAPQIYGAKARLQADFQDIAQRYEERASSPPAQSSSNNAPDASPSSSSADPSSNTNTIQSSPSLANAQSLAPSDSVEDDIVEEDDDIGATLHWTAGDGAHENAIRSLAQDLSREVVSYAFKQFGTAHEVRRRLSRIHQDHSNLPFDVIDAWLLSGLHNTKKQWRIYLLLDFDPPRILKSLPSDERKVSRTGRPTLVDVENFLASEFVTISLPSRHRILDIPERAACLRARKTSRINLVGHWVSVRGGAYAGDVGFACQGDLYYDVLLVPRVLVDARAREYAHDINDNGKRVSLVPPQERAQRRRYQTELEQDLKKWSRRGVRPRAQLLDSSELTLLKKTGNHDLQFYDNLIEGSTPEVSSSDHRTNWSVYHQLPRRYFDEDLLVLRCRHDCLKDAVCIPTNLRAAFLDSQSRHINKHSLPPAAEWRLEIGDFVEEVARPAKVGGVEQVARAGVEGQVTEIRGTNVVVTSAGRDDVEIDGRSLLKVWRLMEYVEVVHSKYLLAAGWVLSVFGKEVDVFTHTDSIDGKVARTITVHRNACRRCTDNWVPNIDVVPHHPHAAPAVALPLRDRRQTGFGVPEYMRRPGYFTGNAPWKGADVVIVNSWRRRYTGFYKGRRGNVQDVELDREDESGLRVRVQLYGVSGQSGLGSVEVVVSYLHVVDEHTGWPLRVAYPLNSWHERNGYTGNLRHFKEEMDGAWSMRRTQKHAPLSSLAIDPTDTPYAEEHHWLLHPDLKGHNVCVFWNRSVSKKKRVWTLRQFEENGVTKLYRVKHGNAKESTSTHTPSHYTPKSPGSKPHDNSRWYCWNGPYKGYFFRGIQWSATATVDVDDDHGTASVGQWRAIAVKPRFGRQDEEVAGIFDVLDSDLVMLADSQADLKANEVFRSRRLNSKGKSLCDPFAS